MLVGDIADSDRVISHLIVNRLKIPQGLPTLLFHWWSDWCSLKGRDPWWFAIRKTMWLTKCDLTCTRKEVTNRLKIPWGLSTLLFCRWSEGSPRGGVHCDLPYCFINMSLFNFIFHNLSQLCKDGVMSDHSMFVFILGPIAGGLCDLVEPVMGHSPLLWTATLLSYIKFLSVSYTHTHTHTHTHTQTHTHTHMLLKETCNSDRVISHIIINRLKIPQCNVKPFCVCIYFRTYCWRPFYDLVEPVVGHSPLLWAASHSYINLFSFLVFVSVSVSVTHTLHHTTHTLCFSCILFSRRNFPHKAANKIWKRNLPHKVPTSHHRMCKRM